MFASLGEPRSATYCGAHRSGRWQLSQTQLIDALLDIRDVIVTCIIAMVLVSVIPVLLGWKSTVVVSGSMMPGIRPGDVIVAAPAPEHAEAHIKPGEVILVDNPVQPGELLLHRFLRYDAQGRMTLKGDANQSADSTPVPTGNLRGIPRLRIPLIGLPYVWIRQDRLLLAVACGFLLMALVAWQPRRPQRQHKTPSHSRQQQPVSQDETLDSPATAVTRAPLSADSYRHPSLTTRV